MRWGLLVMVLGCAEYAVAERRADPLFASHEPLAITLTGDLRPITRDRSDVPEDQPATLSFAHEGAVRSVEIGLRQRGKSRRERDVCTFPPLRMNLPKGEMDGTVFHKQDKLKLVTHCKSGRKGLQYLQREYLAYRIYNLLTDASFRVRRVDVTYEDSARGGRATTHPGFLIEHKDRLAKRLDLELVEVERASPETLEPQITTLAELFQLLISNTDFSFIAGPANDVCCHNAVLFTNPAGLYVPVPYDFDVSGLVDAEYAVPQTALGQRSVRDRLYRGFCRPEPYLANAVAKAQGARAEIFALIADLPDLDPRTRTRVERFVADFYEILDDERKFAREIGDACRGSG